MRTFIIATIALLTSRSYAISNIDLRNVCLEKGKEKIVAIAKSKGCDIDVDTISVSSIDNRWYNNLKFGTKSMLTNLAKLQEKSIQR
jgi:5-enolpyruvylshikimate-3-phosphate synthase